MSCPWIIAGASVWAGIVAVAWAIVRGGCLKSTPPMISPVCGDEGKQETMTDQPQDRVEAARAKREQFYALMPRQPHTVDSEYIAALTERVEELEQLLEDTVEMAEALDGLKERAEAALAAERERNTILLYICDWFDDAYPRDYEKAHKKAHELYPAPEREEDHG